MVATLAIILCFTSAVMGAKEIIVQATIPTIAIIDFCVKTSLNFIFVFP